MGAFVSLLAGLLVATPPLPPPSGVWREMKAVDGIVARMAPSERKAPWGEAEGVIDASPEAVLAHLLAFDQQVKNVPKLQEVRVVRKGEGEAVVYFYFDLPWPVSNRDYTVRYRWERDESGVIRVVIEDWNKEGPAVGDAIRVEFVRGVWELKALEGGKRTMARYLWLAELGGSMTRGMIEQTAWKQPLETIKGIRKVLAGGRK